MSIVLPASFDDWNQFSKKLADQLKAAPGTTKPAKVLDLVARALGSANANALKAELSDSVLADVNPASPQLPAINGPHRTLDVRVGLNTDYDKLHEYDRHWFGFLDRINDEPVCQVDVPSELPAGKAAGAALDIFHQRNAIKVLEDFTLEVWANTSFEIFEDDDYESYSQKVEMSGVTPCTIVFPETDSK